MDTSMAPLAGLSPQTSTRVMTQCEAEAILAALWSQAAGVKRRAGGGMFQVSIGLRRLLRFIKDAEAALGVAIPPTALMRLGTIENLAAAVISGTWPAPTPLALLRDGEPGPVLYVVAAGSGLILELCDLATAIAFPGQVWALQMPGLDGETEPLTRIPDIAQHYVDAIVARGGNGPSHIVGYSFSGVVVLEMARQLHARGHALGLVGILDSTCYEKFWPRSQWALFAVQRLRRRLAEIRAMPPGKAARELAGRASAVVRHVRRRLDSAAQAGKSIYYIGGLEPDFQRVRDASIIAFEKHRPQRLDGCKVVLFKSLLGDPHACDPVGIWKRLIGKLEVVVVPGTHTTMVRNPNAQVLAAEISQRLR